MVGGGGGRQYFFRVLCEAGTSLGKKGQKMKGSLGHTKQPQEGFLPFQALVPGLCSPPASQSIGDSLGASRTPALAPPLVPQCSPIFWPQPLSPVSPLTINTNPVISLLSKHLPLDLSCLLFPFHQPWAPPVVFLPVYLLPCGRQPCARSIRGGGDGKPPAWPPEPSVLLGSPGQYFLLSFCLAMFGFSLGFCPGVVVFLVSLWHGLEIPSNS